MNQKNQNIEDTPKAYDLYLAGNPIHELIMRVRQVSGQQGKIFEQRLSNILQTDVSVTAEVYAEKNILSARNDQTYFRRWVTTREKHPKYSMLTIEKKLSHQVQDRICGGNGKIKSSEERIDPTPGELNALEMLAQTLLDSVFESLKSNPLVLAGKTEEMSADLQFRDIRHHVVSTTYTVITSDFSGSVTLSSPSNNLRSSRIDNARNYQTLEQQLIETMTLVPLPVTAVLGKQESTLRKILSIKVGDIIPVVDPLQAEVFVAEKALCEANVLVADNKLFLQVNQGKSSSSSSESESENERVVEKPRNRRTTRIKRKTSRISE